MIRRPSPGRPKLLVIEDDEGVSQMLRLSLTSAGFDVTEASTGRDAFRSLRTSSPDAVILDLGPPGGLGASVLDLLSLDDREQKSPAWVVISSLDRDEAVNQGGHSGAHYITKPFDPWDLVRLIESLLQGQRHR